MSVRNHIALLLLLVVAGCSAPAAQPSTTPADPSSVCDATTQSGTNAPSITNVSVTVPQNGTTTAELTARNVGEIHSSRDFGTSGSGEPVFFSDLSFDPHPYVIVETLPPYYVWNQTEPEVTVSVTVSATENASLGTHCLPITVWNESGVYEAGATGSVAVVVT